MSGSGVEPGTSAKVCTAHGKNKANFEEIIADGGFGFHAKIKYKPVS